MSWRTGLLTTVGLLLAVIPRSQGQDLESGKVLYGKYCSQCHGDNGDGEGIATPYLQPRPRDFTAGKYKLRTTPTGSLPTDEDLAYVIREGFPFTGMPGFADLGEEAIGSLVAYIKSFSEDFEDPDAYLPPVDLPEPPQYTEASVARGKEVYAETGCARCHGIAGRGDGGSAPTLVDDWGHFIRVADLTQPWTFRAGGTRKDIYRTMSTGFNGTPMPGFDGALPPEDIWSIVDYMVSLSGGPQEGPVQAPYGTVVTAVGSPESIPATGEIAELEALFGEAQSTLFPIFGQITEPGRDFYASAVSVSVDAVYDEKNIAIRLRWNDMRAEVSGSNGPDLQTPLWLDELALMTPEESAAEEDDEFSWGDDDWGEDDWGEEEDTESADDDFWGDEEEDDSGGAATGLDQEFSDAIALQFPAAASEGIRKPYFLFGDPTNAVHLWYSDLAAGGGQLFTGRGSATVTRTESGDVPHSVSRYEDGEWTVIFTRKRKSRSGIDFEENAFSPIAISVWDGFNRERGKRRGVTSWFDLYLAPFEKPSPTMPMVKAGLGVFTLELLIVAFVRYRSRRQDSGKLEN